MEKFNIKTKAELFDFIDLHFDSFTSDQITDIIYNATGNYVSCLVFVDCSTDNDDERENLEVIKWTKDLMKRWIDFGLQPDKRNKGLKLLNFYNI